MNPLPQLPAVAAFEPLLERYGTRKHPLEYANRYQLVVMVVLSARDADKHINQLAPRLFAAYPSMTALATATPDQLLAYMGDVSSATNKAAWLIKMAKQLGSDEAIPTTLDKLTALTGIGRKSANVIIRESGGPAEGIIVDLHVVRVAPRIGLSTSDRPERIEKDLMDFFPRPRWGEVGMAFSFLGREICRPTSPKCRDCPVAAVCAYARSTQPGSSTR